MTKIENQQQYDWAVERVEELLHVVNEDTPEYSPQFIELKLLSNLLADYDEEHFAIGKPTLVEVIQLRLYEMGLNQKALAEMLGVSQSRISEYLSGKSEPTLSIARKISKLLNIDPAIVLGV